jgi:hypothetical protein
MRKGDYLIFATAELHRNHPCIGVHALLLLLAHVRRKVPGTSESSGCAQAPEHGTSSWKNA